MRRYPLRQMFNRLSICRRSRGNCALLVVSPEPKDLAASEKERHSKMSARRETVDAFIWQRRFKCMAEAKLGCGPISLGASA